MSKNELAEIAPTLSRSEQEALVLRYWRRGDLTPLSLANALTQRRPAERRAAA